MELKPGYKQSDLGVIPEEWGVEPLGELSDFVTSGSRGWAQFYSESGALFIRSQNVRDGRLSFEDVQYVSPPTGAEGNRTKVKPNDLLITITGNSVGNVALVEQTFDEAYVSQHVGLVRLREPTTGPYICRYLSPNSPGNPQIAGSQSGQSKPGLNLQNLKDFRIALPQNPNELQAIATALSDMDGLLEGLDRLIAKKRDLKQAVMQQLLTSLTRLLGFHGEWDVNTVAELEKQNLVKLSRGQVISKKDIEKTPGECPIYSSSVHNDGLFGRYGKFMFDEELITWSVDGGGHFFHRRKHKFSVTNVCGFMRVDTSRISYRFFAAELQLLHGRKIFDYQSKSHPSVVRKEYEVRLPPLPEQTAIAEVLTEIDAELAGLEQRREKTRALKQAMMQELLTGRTRLISPEVSHA
jgi:type I restriction enzyme S subunit